MASTWFSTTPSSGLLWNSRRAVKIACAAGIPALIGRDALALKDVDGKEFAKLIIAAAEAGGGWTEYRMTNPATKKVEPKKTYSAKVGDRVLGVGAYNP